MLPDERDAEMEEQVVAALTAPGLCFGQFHVEPAHACLTVLRAREPDADKAETDPLQ